MLGKYIQRVLKMWKTTNPTIEGKTVIFKLTAISQIVFQSFITTVSKHTVKELEKIEKALLLENAYS